MRPLLILAACATLSLCGVAALALWATGGRHAVDYPRMTADLAELAQSVDAPLPAFGFAWLPASAAHLKPVYAELRPDVVQLSQSRDGPHYTVKKKHGSQEDWELVRSTRSARETLAVVRVPPDRKLSRDALAARVLAALEARLEESPGDVGVHMTRVEAGVYFGGRGRARPLLVDSIRRAPDVGALRIALAVVDSADKRPEGMAELERWAREKPSFLRASDVALAHWMLDAPDGAIAAAKEALSRPAVTVRDQSFNNTARIMPIALLAFRHGRYADAIAIVDRLEHAEPEESARKAFALERRAVKAAATFLSGDRAGAAKLVADGLETGDPFYASQNAPLVALAKAIREGDEARVRAFAPESADLARGVFGYFDLLGTLGLPAPR